jgi:putative transposase
MTSEWTGRPKGNSIEMLPGLPPHSPNLNAFAERFVHTVKRECLERLVLVGEHSLFKALHEFEAHYMAERPHQGIGNRLIEPKAQHTSIPPQQDRPLEWECRQRLGGLLKSYSRKAA